MEKEVKKHAENYLQWQWCNSDNEIRITTHWRKLNLHFFTINCKKRQTRKWQIFVRYEYETGATRHRHHQCHSLIRSDNRRIGLFRIRECKKEEKIIYRKRNETMYTENQNKYFISLCLAVFPLPSLTHFFTFHFLFAVCFFSYILFFIWKFGMTGDDALIRSYRYAMWRQHENERFPTKTAKKTTTERKWRRRRRVEQQGLCVQLMVRVSCSAVCCCWFWMFICVLTKSFNLLIFHNGQRISNASNAICLHSDCIHWRLRMEKKKKMKQKIRCKDKHYSLELLCIACVQCTLNLLGMISESKVGAVLFFWNSQRVHLLLQWHW